MSRYRIFIISFFIDVLAIIAFFCSYFMGLLSAIKLAIVHADEQQFLIHFFETIFSPFLITALIIMTIAGLLYRVSGIILVADNKGIESGEKVIWIIGFVMFGFITAIVFMAMGSSRNWTSGEKVIFENKSEPVNRG